ncbi:nucleotide-diphospho-sugar transferase [Bisporella sp. PMI_857]|nr:nucleotide-diphospho-sugar transferase [Bisporella sp. PMI_857]
MAVPRSFRLSLVAALGLILFSAMYLSYTYNLPARATFIEHKHELSGEDNIVLAFPNDPIPRYNFASLSEYPANNINEPLKFAFATLYCTRNPDTRGPYFEATQSIIWRLLWSDYRSKYPIIIFVCPFIPEENRRIFKGQGAIVKEIELLDDIIPEEAIRSKRWMDVLSKLNLWKEIEWERIVFLDSDAFPIMNIDDIFDLVPVQQCKREVLDPEDKAVVDNGKGGEDMCNYVYAGVSQFLEDNINAGMLVLTPNLDMHAKLIRAAKSTRDYDVKDMEQGVLKSKNAFAADGPFPVNRLPPIWNAVPEYYIKYLAEGAEATEGLVRVLHVKMWSRMWGALTNLTQLNDMWDLDWMKMCRFYDSDDGFVEARTTGVYKTPWERFLESQKTA